ncbi:hypothetical protein F5Y13DRAFT_170556 [Hypoxylon sp. FL1857]|nr:hypothetical protein F5Y13DRAFT_170556 [Hypoxylon sp. FL1857]
MFILKELIVRASLLLSRSYTVPAACYDVCNNAYLEAQRVGQTAELCAQNSNFTIYYDNCNTCTDGGAGNITALEPFIDYCSGLVPVTASSTSAPASTSGANPSSSTAGGSLSFRVTQTVLPYTATNGGVATTWSFTTDVTIFAAIPATTVVLITETLNGQLQTYTFTTTYAQLPSDFLNGAASTPTDATVTPSPAPDSEASESPSRAWIAGPVVGGVAGVSLVALGGLLLWRRRGKARQAPINSELHGDDVVKTEMEVPIQPQELDAPSSLANHNEPHELPAERE